MISKAEIEIDQTDDPEPQLDYDAIGGCFGCCPECGTNDGYLNVLSSHVFFAKNTKSDGMSAATFSAIGCTRTKRFGNATKPSSPTSKGSTATTRARQISARCSMSTSGGVMNGCCGATRRGRPNTSAMPRRGSMRSVRMTPTPARRAGGMKGISATQPTSSARTGKHCWIGSTENSQVTL